MSARRRPARILLTGVVVVALTSACADTPLVVAPDPGAAVLPSAPGAPAQGAPAPPQAPPPMATARPASSPDEGAVPTGRVTDTGTVGATTLSVSPVDQRAVVTLADAGTDQGPGVLQIDPDTGAVMDRAALTGDPRSATVSGDSSALVLADPTAGVRRLALPTGTATTDVPGSLTGAQALATGPGGELIIAATGTSSDARREAAGAPGDGFLLVLRDGRVSARVPGLGRPVALAVAGERAAVLDTAANLVHLVDLPTQRVTTRLPAGVGPTAVVVDRHGTLLVTDTRAGFLRRYDITGAAPTPLPPISLGPTTSPYATAYDATTDRLWVTLTATNRLLAIDVGAADRPRTVLDLATVAQPDLIALGQGRVHVASRRTGQVQTVRS